MADLSLIMFCNCVVCIDIDMTPMSTAVLQFGAKAANEVGSYLNKIQVRKVLNAGVDMCSS